MAALNLRKSGIEKLSLLKDRLGHEKAIRVWRFLPKVRLGIAIDYRVRAEASRRVYQPPLKYPLGLLIRFTTDPWCLRRFSLARSLPSEVLYNSRSRYMSQPAHVLFRSPRV